MDNLDNLRCVVCRVWLVGRVIFGLDKIGLVYCEKCGKGVIIKLWFL